MLNRAQLVILKGEGMEKKKVEISYSLGKIVLVISPDKPGLLQLSLEVNDHWYITRAWWSTSARGMNLHVELGNSSSGKPSLFKIVPMHQEFTNELKVPTLVW